MESLGGNNGRRGWTHQLFAPPEPCGLIESLALDQALQRFNPMAVGPAQGVGREQGTIPLLQSLEQVLRREP